MIQKMFRWGNRKLIRNGPEVWSSHDLDLNLRRLISHQLEKSVERQALDLSSIPLEETALATIRVACKIPQPALT